MVTVQDFWHKSLACAATKPVSEIIPVSEVGYWLVKTTELLIRKLEFDLERSKKLVL